MFGPRRAREDAPPALNRLPSWIVPYDVPSLHHPIVLADKVGQPVRQLARDVAIRIDSQRDIREHKLFSEIRQADVPARFGLYEYQRVNPPRTICHELSLTGRHCVMTHTLLRFGGKYGPLDILESGDRRQIVGLGSHQGQGKSVAFPRLTPELDGWSLDWIRFWGISDELRYLYLAWMKPDSQ